MAKLLRAALCLLGAGVLFAQDENYLKQPPSRAGPRRVWRSRLSR